MHQFAMTDMPDGMRAGFTLPLKVIVAADGQVQSVGLDDDINLDDAQVPPKTLAEVKNAIAHAEEQRACRGHAAAEPVEPDRPIDHRQQRGKVHLLRSDNTIGG